MNMTILPGLPGLNTPHPRAHRTDELAGMITQLIEQANANYLQYLAAAATEDEDQVWARFNDSFQLEQDIDTLTLLYEHVARSNRWHMPRQ